MPIPVDISHYLATVPPFDQLPGPVRDQIAARIQITYHTKAQSLGEYKPGLAGDLFIIRAGAVALLGPDGQTLEQRGEGEIFGHAIHFEDQAKAYRVRTLEDVLLWQLPAKQIQTLSDEYPPFKQFLEAPPGERLRDQAQAGRSPRYIRDLPLRPPIVEQPGASIRTCAQRMSESRVSALPIVRAGSLQGILTDRDLRARVIAEGVATDAPVSEVMTVEPVTVNGHDSVDDAMVIMLRHGIHHLPVTDENGALQAVISAGDLLRLQSPHPLRLVRDIARAESIDEVTALARHGPDVLGRLAMELKDVSQVGRIAGLITDACTRRLLELGETKFGQAPMAYTWLAFGSQARLEQGLISDQDNGLLLAENPHDAAADYFEQLSRWVCDGLAACGYTYCNGGVMAMGEWRLSYERWRETFHRWIREPEPKSVMHCSIFFDLRPVYGEFGLAERLREEILHEASNNRIFLRFLAAESMTHRPPLGFFRQFVQEHGGDHSHGLNLKQRGVIPIVDLARVLALEGGLHEVHSEERLLAAAETGLISQRDADNLIQALRFIGRVRLEHQARQFAGGEKPDHLVDPDELTSLHRRYLRSAFSVVSGSQQALAQRFLL